MYALPTIRQAVLFLSAVCIITSAGATTPSLAETSSVTQRFIIRSDTQYPRTKDTSDDPAGSERLMKLQDAAILAWRSSKGGDIPVFLNGDVTEFGHGNEWNKMFEHLRNVPGTYWGLGNHDYDNNVGDCANNGCARDSVQHLDEYVRGWGTDAYHLTKSNGNRQYTGSLSYSKTIGKIKFIQLNNHYNYAREFSSGIGSKTYFSITPSLNWLEQQLEAAQKAGTFPVINMHRPPGDSTYGSEADRERFYAMVKKFKPLTIFHGHTHQATKRATIGDTVVFDSGASFMETFLTAELNEAENKLEVRIAKGNVPGTQYPIPVIVMPAPPERFEFINRPDGKAFWGRVAYSNMARDQKILYIEATVGLKKYRIDMQDNFGLMTDLIPNLPYAYKFDLYTSEGGPVVRSDTGTFRTPPAPQMPTDLCVDDWYGDLGYMMLKWKHPSGGYPSPHIRVEAVESGHQPWIVRGYDEDRQSTTERINYGAKGRNPMAMKYIVTYFSSQTGYSPPAVLEGKDLGTSGCMY